MSQPINRAEFDAELGVLEDRFAALAPELELTVRDPYLGVEGHVVVWTTLAAIGGPLGRVGKGGTRISPTVSLDETKMLARVMSLKNAAAGLPLGGAKSSLCADPLAPGFETKYRRFVRLVKPMLAENGGPFGGFGFDIGGHPDHALWACDELQSTKSFTGKPVHMGGTDYDREGIAGLGVAVAAKAIADAYGDSPPGLTFAVQGLGAMGAAVVRYFSEFGAQLVALSDPRVGGTYEVPASLRNAVTSAIVKSDLAGVQKVLSGTAALSSDEVLFAPCDVLFPCAVHSVITASNAAAIRARYVVEGANGPVSTEARTALWTRGVRGVPDVIANPGGIIAAFVEMTAAPGEDKVALAKALTKSKIAENVARMAALSMSLDAEPARCGLYLALRNIFK